MIGYALIILGVVLLSRGVVELRRWMAVKRAVRLLNGGRAGRCW